MQSLTFHEVFYMLTQTIYAITYIPFHEVFYMLTQTIYAITYIP